MSMLKIVKISSKDLAICMLPVIYFFILKCVRSLNVLLYVPMHPYLKKADLKNKDFGNSRNILFN